MPGAIMDGRALARTIEEDCRRRAEAYRQRCGRAPRLDVVLLGDDPASRVYVRGKFRASERVGIDARDHFLPADTSEADLKALIERLNRDDAVDGLLVQLPLPGHISGNAVIAAIRPEKDVDGFHMHSAGALMMGRGEGFRPCTPLGVMRLIASTGIDLCGKEAVVIGRSNIVGKPLALMLLEANATVTITHSRTPAAKLEEICRRADILIAAAGCPKVVTAQHVKRGAVVVDVGMNLKADGKLCGDVDFEPVRERAAFITPVPGGVGPMTIAMLMQNTVEAAERHEKARARG